MKQAPIEEFLKYIEPGPLALLTTFDGKKKNVMTISWIMPISWDACFTIATGPWNYSYKSLVKTRECAVCIPPANMLETAIGIGCSSGADIDKFKNFKLNYISGETVKVPLLTDCIACLECKVLEHVKRWDLFVMRAVRLVLNEKHKHARMIHAVGDGSFKLDGDTKNYRALMKNKLPPGL